MISIHRVRTISAIYLTRQATAAIPACNWVEVNLTGNYKESAQITIYCEDPALAARIGMAINALNAGPQTVDPEDLPPIESLEITPDEVDEDGAA